MRSIEDLLYPLLKKYNKLPLWFRNTTGVVYRLIPANYRYGSFYKKYKQRINSYYNGQWNSLEHLKNEISYAKSEITYYRKTNSDTNNNISSFPIVDKESIINNFDLFVNGKSRNNGLKANTGGSSGTPFSFYIEKGITRSKEAAHFHWFWGKHGYKEGDGILMIRGKSLKNNADFEYQAIGNKLVVSCYNLNESNISEIYRNIVRFKPKFIHAYPSALLLFTKILKLKLKNQESKLNIKAVFLGSEYLSDSDQRYFEKFYDTKVVNWYGHSECLIHAEKCQLTGDYHFFPFYGYIELIDQSNNIVTEPGVEGRIIATGFDNKVMPLIRYDTGDLGVLSSYKQCKCGFEGVSLSNIIGRGKDFIILKDGTQVSLTAFVFGQHHNEFERIKELQILQSEKGLIELRLNVFDSFNKNDESKLKQRMISSVKQGMLEIRVQYVNYLEKTHRGKHKLLIQDIQQ